MKRFWRIGGAAVIATMASVSAASAAVNLVTNGSFEFGSDPGSSFLTLNPGNPGLTAWTISGGSIDYIGGYWQASNGSRSVDMNGSFQAGTISQIISGLVLGATYRVSFDLAGNPDGPPPTKVIDVSAGGATQTFSFGPVGTRAAMGWQSNSFTFVASGSSTVLSFSPNGDPGGAWGPALDNVSLSAAVPEPETWAMMLIGFLGLGWVSRRRPRVISAA